MQICPNKNCKINSGVMPFVKTTMEQVYDANDGEVEIVRYECAHCNEVWTNVDLHGLTPSKSEVEAQMAAIRSLGEWGTIKGVPPM